jgi:ABC-type arginine transport system ATPase subunit
MDTDRLDEFRGTERFAIERRLGAGGFGVVYRARDRKRDAVIALKTLSRGDSDALYRFKQEFRSLADIAHPNLVTLYELLTDGPQWFFTMELVEGVNFLEHVRGAGFDGSEGGAQSSAPTTALGSVALRGPMRMGSSDNATAEPATLWAALCQLGEGLHALHVAGKLHRDIKPSNVLVTGEGRVVLLDFGLVSELSKEGVVHSMHLVGTPAYMSPEQAAGRPVTQASDWYGVGVMLYEALTGARPFPGQFLDVLVEKQEKEPPAPRELVPAIPEPLDALCRGLLRRDPDDRPAEDEILRILEAGGQRISRPAAAEPRRAAPFVGREADLEALHDAFGQTREGRALVVLVEGLSGVGKSALVRRFLEELRQREGGVVVLAGRCFEQETVPYKALDSLVDALSNYLKRLPTPEVEALLPRDLLALSRVFPVLRQVEAVAAARRRVVAIPDSQELRRRAFGALRELLSRLADRLPLVLFIDDLQWGDADSAALLLELLRPPDPPALLLIASCRSEDVARSLIVAALRTLPAAASAGSEFRERRIEELAPEEARDLARALLGGSQGQQSSADAVARESRGNPLFLDELARAVRSSPRDVVGAFDSRPSESGPASLLAPGAVKLEDVIWKRIAQLPEDARRLLATIAVAGRPLDRAIARRAAELSDNDQPALAVLRAGHLVRAAGAEGEDHVEIYHDRIRETILARLTPSEREASHQRLALALETSTVLDPESLAVHYEAAGAPERAAAYAADAAAKAADALAFDRAARLYRVALELGTADEVAAQKLRVGLGDALANAGRGAEAARAYLAAADRAQSTENLELQRRAAEQLLQSGHVDEGLSVLRRVLDRVGMRFPITPRGALLSLLLRRAQLWIRGLEFRERTAAEIPADDLIRIDTCWSVSNSLGLIDTIRGSDFQTRHLLLALRAGEPYRVARAIANEAGYGSVAGWPARERTRRLIDRSMALAERVGHPHARGLAHINAGIAAYLEGRWSAGWELLQRSEEIFREQCTGVAWELDSAHVVSLQCLVSLGRFRELSEKLSSLLKEAEDRGDLFAATSLAIRNAYLVRLMADEPAEGRRELRTAVSRWSQGGFTMQHYFQIVGEAEISLYSGSGSAAWKSLLDVWWALEKSLLRRIQFVRIESQHLKGRCALAAAGNRNLSVSDREKPLRSAARDARRIERQKTPWGAPLAALLQAGVASHRGDRVATLQRLASAQAGFEAADMSLYAAAARRCRGLLVGGEEGGALVAEADAWMKNEGIRNPERMTAMLAPGRWTG